MKLKQGDRILADISKVTSSTVLADADQWSNVSEIRVNPEVATTVLSPGRELIVDVDRIDGEEAITSQVRGAYSRQHNPGDIIKATAADHIKYHLCEGVTAEEKNIDRLLLTDARPGDVVEAQIEKLRNGLAVATVVSVRNPGIREGDRVEAQTSRGTRKAQTVNGRFEVEIDRFAHVQTVVQARIQNIGSTIEAEITQFGELPTVGDEISAVTAPGTSEVRDSRSGYQIDVGEDQPVKAAVEVEITSIDDEEIRGKLVDVGALPKEGNHVQATVKEGEQMGKVVDASYEVQLDHESLSSGEVTIELTTVSGEIRSGTVRSYRDTIPEKDEQIQAYVRKSKQTANPVKYNCTVNLRGDIPKSGEAIVEITEISDNVYGAVVDYEADSDDVDVVGSKNDLLTGTM